MPRKFQQWIDKVRPDVIFTLYNEVRDWVHESNINVPGDIGLIQLEWRRDRPDWAGMDQHNNIVGEAVVDMLVSMLHRGEPCPPPFPRATLIGGTWIDEKTTTKKSEPEGA